jgi:hypothetical protein
MKNPCLYAAALIALAIPASAQPRRIVVPAAPQTVGDPGPQVTSAVAPQQTPGVDFAVARQGSEFQAKLEDRPQKVVSVKSQATTAKAAIGNLLLSDAGLNLITMAIAPQMGMWNPYMNDSIRKGIDLGKGMLVGHGTDTKGFEYDTLPGATAEVTLKEGSAEFLVPMNQYVPSANFDVRSVEPVLVRLEPRDRDNARLITSRQVLIKQTKTSRFDLKPTVERHETSIEQNVVPITIEFLPGNVVKITPYEPLVTGEYGLVFRKASETGELVQNVPLRPTPSSLPPMFGAMPGSPSGQPDTSARSALGMLRHPSNPAAAAQSAGAPPSVTAGFIAWDFRVLK